MVGRLLAFIGMDGAGKSTVVAELKAQLSEKGFRTRVIYSGRGRNNILPTQFFGRIYKKAGGTESNVVVKKQFFEKISIVHTLAAPVFALDLLLRYFFVIVPALFRNDFVLTDRYSTDILLMNKVPRWLKNFLFLFIPQPNKIFYIYNTINVLHKRKPDHSVEDLERQERIFSHLVTQITVKKIKNDRLSACVQKILGVML